MPHERLRTWLWEPAGPGGEPPRLRTAAVYPLLALVVAALGFIWPIMAIMIALGLGLSFIL